MERERSKSQSISRNLAAVCLLSVFVGSCALLGNTKARPLLKFCFNSRDQFVAAQCVLCDFYQFSATVLGCNGKTSALMSNITSTEAVCIISNCLQQVRQGQPQFTGRRRRDTFDASEVPELTYDVSEDSAVHKDFDDAESLSERVDLADALPSMKEFLNRYTFIDDKSAKELEEQVVDRIEVTVAEDEEIDDF
ncbi:uncharacterized protein LOC129964063 [Argiope bruennichi]|uniref:uncharacterized protein LOC129964063 n=1 Tax=Argiope bruennichi TaxID=94029 RepID=UPI002494678F|nr:uncharacterized protein LOC129964063 [Argiope bruennichi]